MRLAARSTAIASALAITAIGAPAASARFDPAPIGTAQSQTTTSAPVVRSNPDQQTAQSGPAAPPILRPARGSEQAALNRAQAAEARASSSGLPPTARYSSADLNAYASTVHPVAATTPTVKAPSDGFHYDDAGIGAGITAAMLLLIAAGTVAVRERSQPRHP